VEDSKKRELHRPLEERVGAERRSSKSVRILGPLILFALLQPAPAFAWGGRGHFMVCDVAIRLVEREPLSAWLKDHSQGLAGFCWIPDTDWKRTKSDRKKGNPAHWINPEKIGRTIESLPLDWSAIQKETHLKGSKLHEKLGGLWWRAEQFREKGCDVKQEWRNRAESLGLLGHFVGDGSQPLHLTEDYDGAKAGHAKIHSFYEHSALESYDSTLWNEVESQARKVLKSGFFDPKTSLPARMKKMATEVFKDHGALIAQDKVEERKEKSAEIFKAWRPQIVRELAYSAALQAQLWEECSGEVPKSEYRSYWEDYTQHPPSFVAPSYYR
jgi:hypothetical protein